jgi:hypothetical protein
MRFSPVQKDDPKTRIRSPFDRLTQCGIDPDQFARTGTKVPGKPLKIAQVKCLHLQHCRRLFGNAARTWAASGGRCGDG